MSLLYACRECGDPCGVQAFEDNDGLCFLCRFVPRRKRDRFVPIFVNGRECLSEAEFLLAVTRSAAAPVLHAVSSCVDPIRAAIDRACVAVCE